MSFSTRGNFGQLKIGILHYHLIEKESLEYLRGTPWHFLDIGFFSARFQIRGTKKRKLCKKSPKNDISIDFRILLQKTKVA